MVNSFFTAVQGYDFAIFDAVRNDRPVSIPEATDRMTTAVKALDRLLATVPQDITEKARVIVAGVAGARAVESSGERASQEALRIEQLLPKAK